MFGMGFMEIFLVLIVAVIALGPEKLPSAAVDIARFFKKFKSGLDDAKSTLDNELNISEMKREAEEFKSSVSNIKNITTLELDNISSITDDDMVAPSKPKEVIQEKSHISLSKDSDEFRVKPIKKETISFSKNEEV